MYPSESTNVTIRSASAEDATQIAEIYKYYVERTTISFEIVAPDATEIRRRLESFTHEGLPYIVAERDGRILGYAYAHLWKERQAYCKTWESTIYIANELKKTGIGSRLMHSLIELSRNKGCHTLIACITAENTASRCFHENLGFQLVSEFRQVGYKNGRYLDVTDYQLIL